MPSSNDGTRWCTIPMGVKVQTSHTTPQGSGHKRVNGKTTVDQEKRAVGWMASAAEQGGLPCVPCPIQDTRT
eukprot:9555762-Prorocentrum_lima.AAC.1